MIERIAGETDNEVNLFESNRRETFGIKPIGRNLTFSEHLERMGGYMSKRIRAGRESMNLIPPIVSGEGLGHDASARVANADEQNTFFHMFHSLLGYHRSLVLLPATRNHRTFQLFRTNDMRVEF